MRESKTGTSRPMAALAFAVIVTYAAAGFAQADAPTPSGKKSPSPTPATSNGQTASPSASDNTKAGRCAPGNDLDRVLACMDEASARFRQAQANVELVQYTAVVKEKDVQTGQVFFRRRGHDTEVALWIQNPHPKQAVVKGGKVIFFDPGTKQVTERALGDNKSDVEAVMNLGFGGRGEDLLKQYDVTLGGWEKIDNRDTARLELVAKSERLRRLFSKLVLWIDPVSDVALQQQRFEASGDYQLTHYTNIRMSSKIPDDKFVVKQ